MKYNIYDESNINDAIKYYYNNKVSHKETYEKFNIKRSTYFTYLKLNKDKYLPQNGGNKNIFKTKTNITSSTKEHIIKNDNEENSKKFVDFFTNNIKPQKQEKTTKQKPQRLENYLNKLDPRLNNTN